MNINYTGQAALAPAQQKKLDARFVKLGKLLDRGGEKSAHVILTKVRHQHRAEITVNYYDHPLAGKSASSDQFTAMIEAVDHLERQILKLREKRRDGKRVPLKGKVAVDGAAPAEKAAPAAKPKVKVKAAEAPSKRVFRVNNHRRRPLTVEEAMLDFEPDQKYMVYRDAESDRTHVLVKRADGHFDLIEA